MITKIHSIHARDHRRFFLQIHGRLLRHRNRRISCRKTTVTVKTTIFPGSTVIEIQSITRRIIIQRTLFNVRTPILTESTNERFPFRSSNDLWKLTYLHPSTKPPLMMIILLWWLYLHPFEPWWWWWFWWETWNWEADAWSLRECGFLHFFVDDSVGDGGFCYRRRWWWRWWWHWEEEKNEKRVRVSLVIFSLAFSSSSLRLGLGGWIYSGGGYDSSECNKFFT